MSSTAPDAWNSGHASVGDDVRHAIRRRLESRLASTPRGPIELTARASAVQGVA